MAITKGFLKFPKNYFAQCYRKSYQIGPRVSISKKFLSIIILATLIPTMSVGISVYYFLNNALKEQIGESFRDKLDFYRISLESKLSVLKENSTSWASNFVFMDILKRDDELNIATYIKNLKDAHAIVEDIVVMNYETGFITTTNVKFMEQLGDVDEPVKLETINAQKKFAQMVTQVPFLNLKDVYENKNEYASLSSKKQENYYMLPIKNYFDETKSLGVMIILLNRSVLDNILLKNSAASDSGQQKYNIYFSLENRLIFGVENVFRMPFAKIFHFSESTEKTFSVINKAVEKIIVASIPLDVPLRGYEGKLHVTLAQPESLAFSSVKKINGIVLTLSLFALLIFIPLGFFFARSISSPISKLKSLTEEIIVSGDLSKRIRVSTNDEMGSLSVAFNHLLSAVNDSRRKLEKYNESLELFVAERTKELGAVKFALAEMLNNMKQAILTFDQDLLVNPEYSSFINILLEDKADFTGRNVLDLISGSIIGNKEEFRSKLDFYFSILMEAPKVQWEVLQEELPSEIKISVQGSEKDIKISFEPIFSPEGNTTRIMLIMEDVSHLKKLQKIAAQKQADLERISQLINLKGNLFEKFYDETLNIIYKLHAKFQNKKEVSNSIPVLDWQDIYRAAHTIKGNARLFRLMKIQDMCHQIEESLESVRNSFDYNSEHVATIMGNIESLRDELFNYKRLFDELFGSSAQESEALNHQFFIEIKSGLYKALKHMWQNYKTINHEMWQMLFHINRRSLQNLSPDMQTIMDCFKKEAISIADELGKKIRVYLYGDNIKLTNEQYSIINNSLIHLVRNAVDHGLEKAENRIQAGKDATGTLLISWRKISSDLEIKIRDDGNGLDSQKIIEKAKSLGIFSSQEPITHSEGEARNLIFDPSFSMAPKVTSISGRGVGLDAVRHQIAEGGGNVRVESEAGKFTEFVLTLPLPSGEGIGEKLWCLRHEIDVMLANFSFGALEIQNPAIIAGSSIKETWVLDKNNERLNWLNQFFLLMSETTLRYPESSRSAKLVFGKDQGSLVAPNEVIRYINVVLKEDKAFHSPSAPLLRFSEKSLKFDFNEWRIDYTPPPMRVVTMTAKDNSLIHKSFARLNIKWQLFGEYIVPAYLSKLKNLLSDKKSNYIMVIDNSIYSELNKDRDFNMSPNILLFVIGGGSYEKKNIDESMNITFLDFIDDIDEAMGFVILESSYKYFNMQSQADLYTKKNYQKDLKRSA